MEGTSNPKVSVCIPTFQHVEFISQCLDSVLSQKTNFAFEIVLGEDASTDGTRKICEEYAKKYPQLIRLFLRSEKDKVIINGKPSGRYNIINNLKEARGEYIALLDGDDYFCDDLKLQRQVDFLEANKDHAICFHRVYEKHADKKNPLINSQKTWDKPKSLSALELASGDFLAFTCGCMYRNHLYEELPPWFWSLPYIDNALHIWNAQFGKIGYLPEPMAVYRINSGSMWATQSKAYKLQLLTDLVHILIQNFNGEIKEKLLEHQGRLFTHLLPIVLEENNTALEAMIKKSASYPDDFYTTWVAMSMRKLHTKFRRTTDYRLKKFLRPAWKWLTR